MACKACGQQNREGARYCAWCGALLANTPPHGQNTLAAPEHPQGLVTRKLDLADLLTERPPLQIGDVIANRYEILALLEETVDYRTYRAIDRGRCAVCGHEHDVSLLYCDQCGALLDNPPHVTIVEYETGQPEAYEKRWQHQGRDYFVLPSEAKLPQGNRPPAVHFVYGSATHPGCRMQHNEDALAARIYADHLGTNLGFFAVADGVGGHQGGEIASQLALATVWEALYQSVWQVSILGNPPSPEDCEQAVIEALQKANEEVYASRQEHANDMGTTLTLALIVGTKAFIGNVGDSRVYLRDAQGLHRITRDHSLVQRMVEAGKIGQEEIYTHPQRNIIYRSIGDQPRVEVDAYTCALSPGDCLLLCSDGLWEMVRDDGLEEVLLAEYDPQIAAERLVRHALLAGGDDNISVIIVQARP